jgi:hypothetical protein
MTSAEAAALVPEGDMGSLKVRQALGGRLLDAGAADRQNGAKYRDLLAEIDTTACDEDPQERRRQAQLAPAAGLVVKVGTFSTEILG